MDGTWKSTDTWGGLGAGMLKIASVHERIPADVRKMAAKVEADIASGKFHPFTGPLNKQDGKPFLKAGEKASDGLLAGMNFYVQGVEGSLPK